MTLQFRLHRPQVESPCGGDRAKTQEPVLQRSATALVSEATMLSEPASIVEGIRCMAAKSTCQAPSGF